MKKAGRAGKARTGDLVRVMGGFQLAWVKAHVAMRERTREGQILHLGGGTGGPDRGRGLSVRRWEGREVGQEGSYQIHSLPDGQGQSERLAAPVAWNHA